MTADHVPLLRRPHTVLGVCEAIGEDFGFNPLFLRIAFAAGMFFSAKLVIAAYLGLGLIVAVSRWLSPVPTAAPAEPVAATPVKVENEEDQLKLAA